MTKVANHVSEVVVLESLFAADYLELQCCLSSFSEPCIMDVKMGTRTYLETEVGLKGNYFK